MQRKKKKFSFSNRMAEKEQKGDGQTAGAVLYWTEQKSVFDSQEEYKMNIRPAAQPDLPALLDIYNYEVSNGTATFDLVPKTLEQRQEWLDCHNVENHPLLVAEENDTIMGYASLSDYRPKEAYRSTVELSVYVHPRHRGKGVASAMMEAILEEARRDERTHTVVSVITSGNDASTRLHEKFGFTFCGRMREMGWKFGRLLDIDNWQLFV